MTRTQIHPIIVRPAATRACVPAVCFVLSVLFVVLSAIDAAETPAAKSIPAPPLMRGGFAGLWEFDHIFIARTYGEFDLLHWGSVSPGLKTDSTASRGWQLTAMGNFSSGDMQYATFARVKTRPDSLLLIVFAWKDAVDSLSHGILLHTMLPMREALLKTTQGPGGLRDTVHIWRADSRAAWGACYFDDTAGRIVLRTAEH